MSENDVRERPARTLSNQQCATPAGATPSRVLLPAGRAAITGIWA
jgi:hypothetical protein